MHVTQDEFRCVNKLHKQMAYAVVCYLISGCFLVTDSEPPPQLRRKILIITSSRMKRALHIQLHENFTTLESYLSLTAK